MEKFEENTEYIFFPIDGFTNFNKNKVLKAQKELEYYLKEIFNCKTQIGYVDINSPEFEISI
ncbi:hypothetical protein [Gemella cuniculi]|uniref:hypothetical protein n=1 Tax=Gemella cuniculi TaxID=150240 RepID=UPI00042332C9|nr:hypothetical protein [Gemella cuniculi]